MRSDNQIKHDVEGSIYIRSKASIIEVKGRKAFRLNTKKKIGFVVKGNAYYRVKKIGIYWHILGDKKPKLKVYDTISIGLQVEGYFHKYSSNLFRDKNNVSYTCEENLLLADIDYKIWKVLPPITDRKANIFETDSVAFDKRMSRRNRSPSYDPTVKI